MLSYLMSDKHIARAAHPTINAWRCSVNGVMHQGLYICPSARCKCDKVIDNDDDGETAAGGRLAHLLQIMVSSCAKSFCRPYNCSKDLDHVLVVVTRFYGGILLGADR